MRRLLRGLALTLALVLNTGLAVAEETPATPATPTATEASQSEATKTELSLWQKAVLYVRDQQRDLHRQLAGAIKALRREGPTAAWSLIVLSFLYGIFHAAGPGHGKVVISTYLATHPSALGRGLWLSTAAALVQGLTAILLVLLLVSLVGRSRAETQATVGTLETVSFALIALLGLGLALRALWSFARTLLPVRQAAAEAAHGAHGAHCSHNHGPDSSQLAQPLSLKTGAAIVLSIGIRPCSGAVLVLLFAEVLALRWAGIAAVLAMSLGTAATVGALAFIAVNFRRLAAAAIGYGAGSAAGGRSLALAGQAVALLGGVLITLVGASLFFGSLGARHPLL